LFAGVKQEAEMIPLHPVVPDLKAQLPVTRPDEEKA